MNARTSIAILIAVLAPAGAAWATAPGMLVANSGANQILKYNATTGAYEGVFIDLSAQGYGDPRKLVVGPDGNLYVQAAQGIARYNATTGAYVDLLYGNTMPNGKAQSYGMAIAPGDGRVFVAAWGGGDNSIYAIDPQTKAASVFFQSGGEVRGGLTIGDGGDLYLYCDTSGWNRIRRVDIDTGLEVGGEYIVRPANWDNHTSDLAWALSNPADPASGSMYWVNVDSSPYSVVRTNVLAPDYSSNEVLWTNSLAFLRAIDAGPDGKVYFTCVADGTTGIKKINPVTGAVSDFVVGAGELGGPSGIAWQPVAGPASWHPGDANKDGKVNLEDFGLMKDNFGLSQGAAWEQADFNRDGKVNLEDFGILKDHFGHTAGDSPVTGAPEPASIILLLGLGAVSARRRARAVRNAQYGVQNND